MPELPEVETTKTSLLPLIGQTVQTVHVHNSSLRWAIPQDVTRLVGQTLKSLTRRSKYILAEFNQDTMLWHLGMSGSFRICEPSEPLKKHDHFILGFKELELRYHDPRRFGCILWLNETTQTKLLDTLGPEPLTDAFNAEYLQQKLKNKKVAIKVALMDNHVVVGVGNIYATESLFNLGIHPAQPACDLDLCILKKLVVEIKRILKQAIELGGSTLRDYTNANGENGYFQQTLLAYGRAGEMCVNCETTLENLKLGQRASVFCPQCQPLKKGHAMSTAIVRHILVKDIAQAEMLKQKLKNGADFAKLAKQHSICNSANRGGELGEVKKGQLVPVIDKLVFSAPEKVLQGPIKSKFGYHLLEVKFRMGSLR